MNNIESNTGEIVMYQPDETIRLEVRVENETVWLNRQQIADLFSRDIKTVGKHINNALKEELKGEPVGAKFATTAADGKNYQVEYFNLDMIMSVGYRVKSKRGIQFRRWSNKVLKQSMLSQRTANVSATIYTRQLSQQQQLDIRRHNQQYPPINICTTQHNHDRFLIIDDDVYLFGASLKDAGKKLFAYIKMQETSSQELINRIK